jgi:hypothetical protein
MIRRNFLASLIGLTGLSLLVKKTPQPKKPRQTSRRCAKMICFAPDLQTGPLTINEIRRLRKLKPIDKHWQEST